MNQHHYAAIMAGGVGSRFWPGSREKRPKQFLDILGVGKSLLRLTFERFQKVLPSENIYIVTNGVYRDLVAEQLPELRPDQILCEPSRNNTAPCIAYAAFKLAGLDPEACMVVAPSDHIILKEDIFVRDLHKCLAFASQNNALLTMGITPTRPDTGYGYINFDRNGASALFKVKKFTEKPHLADAQKFLESGDYLWNAGIFIWKATHVIEAFKEHSADIYDIFNGQKHQLNTASEESFLAQYYPTTPNISIDYAIMEKATNVYTLPADIGWSDLGTWGSLYAESDKDEHGNTWLTSAHLGYGTKNCLIRSSDGKLVVVKDLQNYIIIDEPDVLLICPMSKEQEIKQITSDVGRVFGATNYQ